MSIILRTTDICNLTSVQADYIKDAIVKMGCPEEPSEFKLSFCSDLTLVVISWKFLQARNRMFDLLKS